MIQNRPQITELMPIDWYRQKVYICPLIGLNDLLIGCSVMYTRLGALEQAIKDHSRANHRIFLVQTILLFYLSYFVGCCGLVSNL